MSCTNPLKAWQIGVHQSGKPNYKITSYAADHVEKVKNTWSVCYEPFTSKYAEQVQREFIEIPCGKCTACRLENAKQWTDRCLAELKYNSSAYFLTLTYDNNHIKRVHSIDEYGELIERGTLYKKDFQLFMKRLRKEYSKYSDNKLRFFAAGEYGDSTWRPHYHAIIFGLDLKLVECSIRSKDPYYNVIEQYKTNKLGQPLFMSNWLNDIWQNGFVVVGDVTEQSISYTCRYVIKKSFGYDKNFFENLGLLPEFTLMSRRPGIARRFYDDNKNKLFSQKAMYISTPNGSHEIKPCRYYEKLYDIDNPDDYALLKANKKEAAETTSLLKLENTSLDYLEYKNVEEQKLVKKMDLLPRKEI